VRIVQQLCDYQAGALQPIVWMALGAARGEARDFDAPTSPCSGQRAVEQCVDRPQGSTLPTTLQGCLRSYPKANRCVIDDVQKGRILV